MVTLICTALLLGGRGSVANGLRVYKWSTVEEGSKGKPFGWVPWSEKDGRAKFIWVKGVAHSGERSLCIKGAKGWNSWVSASFPIDPEREYVFTAYVKGENATGRNYIAIRFGGGGWWAKHASPWLWGGRFYEGIATLRSKSIEGTTRWVKLRVKTTPPEGATWMTLLCCSEDNKGAVYFDDLLLVEKLPKPLLFYPHIGFHPSGAKNILVGSEEDEGGGKFFLLDYGDHKVEGSVVYEGELRRIESSKWLPYVWEADLTNFRKPGIYRLLVRFRSGKGCLSRTFKIDRRIYDDVLKFARNWFFVQRCGTEVPGWHKPCHLDDAVVRETRRGSNFGRVIKRVDARGGWHEGGGFGRHIGCVWLGVFPFAEAVGLLNLPEEVKGELLDEAKWGADWLLKMQAPDGMFYDGVNLWEWRKDEKTGEWRKVSLPFPMPPERQTDNIPGTEDDRIIPLIGGYCGAPVSFCCWQALGLARLALTMKERDPRYAKRLIEAARRTWEKFSKVAIPLKGWEREGEFAFVHAHGALLWLDTYLRLLTGEERYKRDAEKRIEAILSCQKPDGRFAPNPKSEARIDWDFYYPLAYVLPLCDWVEHFPEGRERIEKALRRFLSFVEPRLNLSPFHQLGELVPNNPRALPDLTPYNALNTYLSGTAGFLSSVAIVLREPKWLRYAEFQIQWILGRNPRRVCMVEGLGWKTPGAIMNYLAFAREQSQRLIPGAVANGILGGGGPRYGAYINDLEVDYPVFEFGLPNVVGHSHGWSLVLGQTGEYFFNEAWVLNQGWFAFGLVRVMKALEIMGRFGKISGNCSAISQKAYSVKACSMKEP